MRCDQMPRQPGSEEFPARAKHTPTPHGFVFGPLQFKVIGEGIFCGHEKLRAKVAELSADEIRAANKAAWKMRRAASRKAEKFCNVSVYGARQHDEACFLFDVADAVRKVTYAALATAGAL